MRAGDRRRRRGAAAGGAVGAGVLVLLGFAAAGRTPLPPSGEWVEVTRGSVAREIDVSGTLEAADSAILGPPQVPDLWEFKITFLAPEGQQVGAGTDVIRFDTAELERRLLDRRGEARKAGKELEKRRSDLAAERRSLELRLAEARARHQRAAARAAVPEELAAAVELEKAELDVELARREVAYLEERLQLERRRAAAELASLADRRGRAEARVRELEERIEAMTVRAPRGGTVVYRSDRGREKPKVGDAVWRGRSLVEIPDLGTMIAAGAVDEPDAGRVAVGQSARLTLDALPGVQLRGKVAAVGRSVGRRDRRGSAKVVEVEIALTDGSGLRLRPGMRFRGGIETERRDEVLSLPAAAVRMTAGGPRVEVRRGLRSEVVEPRLGLEGGGRVEVLGGLEEGDRVRLAAPARREVSPPAAGTAPGGGPP